MKSLFKKTAIFLLILFLLQETVGAATFSITDDPKVISREKWGADESFTLKEETTPPPQAIGPTLADDEEKSDSVQEKDPETKKIITKNSEGKEYFWPLEYAKKIRFVVMHHTAVTNNLDNPIQDIRNIYHSHAVTKGWGDIGYHFLIDKFGNIYEGRKGGKSVIGGHAIPVNKTSIGISLMGNFEENELSPKMLASTISLLAKLAKQYKIKPESKTKYKGKVYDNLHGHKDNSPKIDPGKFFYQKFPYIRRLLSYMLAKKIKEKYSFTEAEGIKLISTETEKSYNFTLKLLNTGRMPWRQNTFLENKDDKNFPVVFAKMAGSYVRTGKIGTFTGKLPKNLPSGMLMPNLTLVANGTVRLKQQMPVPIMVQKSPKKEKPVRVALSFSGEPEIKSESGMYLLQGSKSLKILGKDETAKVSFLGGGKYRVSYADKEMEMSSPPRFKARSNGILTIANFENRPGWNKKLNDNMFRGILEVRRSDKKLTVINELPLEDYLKGIAEISNNDPAEKIKTIIILARSYAKYYRDVGKKFAGKPYDLDDNPDHTQKYVGYGLELRSPNIVKAVKDTSGKIVKYNDKQVITPYFNQSDGRTRSAEEAWGWENAPYLQSVPDEFCGTKKLKGHGVGLSGCGATELAKQGKTAEEIIKYYYKGVEITD